tara:strand:+ start:402 stop:575 length:174 start_codon:yes stop_codon:yes gene_type:complete
VSRASDIIKLADEIAVLEYDVIKKSTQHHYFIAASKRRLKELKEQQDKQFENIKDGL